IGNRYLLAHKLRQDGLRIDARLHDCKPKRHDDRARSTRRTGDDAALDADFHSHDASRDTALARRAYDRSLITQVKRCRLALPPTLAYPQTWHDTHALSDR